MFLAKRSDLDILHGGKNQGFCRLSNKIKQSHVENIKNS